MNVAIAGYGIEGKVSYRYWREHGDEVTIVDERDISVADLPFGARAITGSGAFKALRDFDIVVRTPSLPPKSIKTRGKVWSATNEFFVKCPADIIGVTGTKGKGTTASLIAGILTAAGKTVHLVGNIGTPALEVLNTIKPDDIVVFELSSFQLWDLQKSPHIAVVLMIEADHLDIHSSLKDYVAAKAMIRQNQRKNDVCLYHPTNKLSQKIANAGRGHSAAVRYGVEEDGQVYAHGNTFFVQNTPICSVLALQVVGEHNIENACAAISVALIYEVDNASIEKGLRSFTGLPHRLKQVKTIRGVDYYDDSIATTPGSAIAAVKSFAQPKYLILGGKDKGGDYKDLIDTCKQTNTTVLTMGANGPTIAKLCKKHHVEVVELGDAGMDEVVKRASELAHSGSVVILSPAAASFDMFKSYSERGDRFVTAVEGL